MRYEKYKESGVEWIGEVPSHWEVMKTSLAFNGIGSGTTPSTSKNEYYTEEDGLYWLQTGDLNDGEITDTSKKITLLAAHECNLKFYPVDSVVIAMYGATIGKVGLLKISTSTNQACCVLPKSKRCIPSFAFYLFLGAKKQLLFDAMGGGQPNISQDTIKKLKVSIPPQQEQRAIVSYLDEKCAKINGAIEVQKKKIDLLNELKNTIITNAVIKGLNPDTPMKDSGVEWIGQVPEHWEVCKLKNHTKIILGKMLMSTPPKGEEHLYSLEKYLKSKNIGWLQVIDDYDEVEEMWFNDYEKELYHLEKYDLVMNEGGDVGKIGIWNNDSYDCYIQNSVNKITADSYLNPFYLQYLIFAIAKTNYFWSIVNPVSIAHLTKEKLSTTPILIPSIEEQELIVEHLDKKVSKIDTQIFKANYRIELLNELKQSIITEAVTGKVKVC